MNDTTAPPPPAPPLASYSPAPPPVPPTPPRPKPLPVPGAGARFFAVCAGLSLLALAGLLLAERAGLFTGPVVLTTLGITAVVFGLGIVVAGVRGRTSGVLGFFAVMAMLLSFPAAVAADTDLGPWRAVDRWDGVGSNVYTPTTLAEVEGGFAVGMGEMTVDLTELVIPEGDSVEVALQSGLGSIDLVLPTGESVRLALSLGGGDATWDLDDESGSTSGLGVRRTVTQGITGDDEPTFDIRVNAGLGDITITQED